MPVMTGADQVAADSDLPSRSFGSFDEFVAQRGESLWRQAWLLTHDRAQAEDLVQTTLAKCYGRFARLNRDGSSFEAYVRRVLYTTYLSWRRRRWRGEVPADGVGDVAQDDRPGDASLDLSRALQQLPRAQRAVIVLRYLEDLSEADTAEALGISVGTVKSHAHRALAALRTSTHLKEDS